MLSLDVVDGLMPRLQVVVCVCDLQFKFYSLPLRVSLTGGIFIELKGEKLCDSCAIILHSTCRISAFCQFLPVSGRTTACKRGIR